MQAKVHFGSVAQKDLCTLLISIYRLHTSELTSRPLSEQSACRFHGMEDWRKECPYLSAQSALSYSTVDKKSLRCGTSSSNLAHFNYCYAVDNLMCYCSIRPYLQVTSGQCGSRLCCIELVLIHMWYHTAHTEQF